MCRRFINIFGFKQPGCRSQNLDIFCYKCGGVLCNESCVDDSDELLIFDVGSKTTWLKYEGENTGQLSMHPTVCPLPGTEPSSDDSYLIEKCPVCNRNRVIRGNHWKKNSRSHNTQCHKADKKKFTSALSKLSLRNFHCFDSSQLDTDSLSSDENLSAALIKKTDDVADDASVHGDVPGAIDDARESDGAARGLKPVDAELAETCVDAMMFLMRHMLRRNAFLLKRHVPYVICQPSAFSDKMKQDLIRFVFEDLKIPGLCFIPKSVAISLYMGLDTCLVIDSGANNTVVTPVVDQLNCDYRAQSKPVGGTHVSRWLQECIAMKGYDCEIEAAMLDSSHIMRECWVAYNPTVESKRKLPNKEITIKGKTKDGTTKYFPVELSHELYLSVEDMYTNLNIPEMVLAAVEHFSISTQRQLLSNIVLSGGNCRLNGLANRITRDVQAACPRHSGTIHVCDPRLIIGRTDAVEGASYVKVWEHAKWRTRRDYVVNGV